ncbi:HK97 gp10 family phage protein [uncultured Cedecea sp.]|uniref:HK97 gp10 family phage protein n=1 Tax=uncultured Cedecea sp. TaxID=988762 RepID=UPI00260B5D86|nr:HK97 gp10 family phage protein [uncultured Cedecea sp.]
MGVKVRGLEQVQARMDALIGDIQGRKAVRGVQSAMFVVGAEAASKTPRDTATLVNSQFRELSFIGTRLIGRVGFSANYAAYVHDAAGKLKGQPRANGRGDYWNPHGEPEFLKKAVEEKRDQVVEIIRKELGL